MCIELFLIDTEIIVDSLWRTPYPETWRKETNLVEYVPSARVVVHLEGIILLALILLV